MLSFNAFLVLSLNLAFSVKAQWDVGQEVKTTSGLIKGHASKTYPEVSEYLGVRFGQTTGGENRFMPPKRYDGTGKIDASSFVGSPFRYSGHWLTKNRARMHTGFM
jgi:cholinesterase